MLDAIKTMQSSITIKKAGRYMAGMLAGIAIAASAGVEYIPNRNIIWVTQYPRDYPCTLEHIRRVDRINGWGKVKYQETNDTYVILSHLYIGTDNQQDTYFQIGDGKHPGVTAEMHGNIIIYPDVPPFTSDVEYQVKTQKTTPGANVLQMGDPANELIAPTVKFAPGHGLAMGFGDRRWPYAGELFIYNTTITSISSATGRVVGLNGWLRLQGRTIRMVNSRIENVAQGVMGVMGGGWDHEVRGVTFENMGAGLSGYWDSRHLNKPLENCKFIGCTTALARPTAYVLLRNCTFTRNQRNWDLDGKELHNIFLENCTVEGQMANGALP